MDLKRQVSIAVIVILYQFIACSQENNKIPQKAPKDTPAYGDVFMSSSIGDAANLIPMLASDSSSHEVAGYIFNGMVKYDKDFNIVPDLAQKWEIEDGGKLLRFHLRKGVMFHDGEPLTAQDVFFTYKTIIDPKTPTAYAEKYKLVKDVRIVDDYTIEIRYEKPFAPALISWGLEVLPEHLLKGVDITNSELARKPVGTGPYKFKGWETGSRIVLEAFDKYFEGRPHLSGVVYRIIPDQTTEFMELKAGNIDIMGLTPLQYLRQTDNPDFKAKFVKYKYLADGYTYLGFNLKRAPFTDVKIRQAIAHAIDKQEIIRGVLYGLGLEATGPYKPGTVWYNPQVKQYPYDPQKALAILNAEGYADHDGDGIIDRDGKPFEFTIITNQGNPLREKTAQIIQHRLKSVGIKVNIRVIEWTVFLKEFVDKSNFDAVILGWNILQDPDLYEVWHSQSSGPNGLNFISFKDMAVDDLLVKGRHTFDNTVRKGCYDKIQEILAEQQPYVFLYVPYSLPVVSSRIKGIVPAPAGITYNFKDWYVPKNMQKYSAVP